MNAGMWVSMAMGACCAVVIGFGITHNFTELIIIGSVIFALYVVRLVLFDSYVRRLGK